MPSAYVLMPASAIPYAAMGVPLTRELIYGLTGVDMRMPSGDTAYHPSYTVSVQ